MRRIRQVTARFYLRALAVTACAIAFPLYTTEEIVTRLRGRPWHIPLVDRLDDWLSDLEDRIEFAGDLEFGARLGEATDRVSAAVDAALTRTIGRA